MADVTMRIYRGDRQGGKTVDYAVPLTTGMVVLDAVHAVQAQHAPDLAVRWNCKAAKCGSCLAVQLKYLRTGSSRRWSSPMPVSPLTMWW